MEFVYAYAYFLIYCFLGWICECTYVSVPKGHFVNRGFLYGPYIPIYGFGAMIAVYPLMYFQHQPILVFLFGVLFTSLLEYFTSWAMEKLFHSRWWDYSCRRFNLNGRICLLNSTLFGLMSLFAVYVVHPLMTDFIYGIPLRVLIVCLVVYSIVFMIDFAFTLRALIRQRKIVDRIKVEMEQFRADFEKEQAVRMERLMQQRDGLEKSTREKLAEFERQRKAYMDASDAARQALTEQIEVFQSRQEEKLNNLKKEVTSLGQNVQVEMAKALKNSPIIKEKHIEPFLEVVNLIRNTSSRHLSLAFPNRKLEDSVQELSDIAKLIDDEMKKMKADS